jgi:hypothetical protein
MKILFTILILVQCGCSSYVYRAYFKNGPDTAIRGYPTIDPPAGFTGVWTHYKWNGDILAHQSYIDGENHGTSFWFKDDGAPYLIRLSENGRFVKDYYQEPLPKARPKIPFWFPARYQNVSVKSSLRESYPQ